MELSNPPSIEEHTELLISLVYPPPTTAAFEFNIVLLQPPIIVPATESVIPVAF